jgi:hypothetical protein
MLRELAVERFRFACLRCRRRWEHDYAVQHVTDEAGRIAGGVR